MCWTSSVCSRLSFLGAFPVTKSSQHKLKKFAPHRSLERETMISAQLSLEPSSAKTQMIRLRSSPRSDVEWDS